MDGFQDSSGITVIAATNQEENIDEALLRPGRFDRKIKVELPDFDCRCDIFKIHLGRRNINFTIEGVEMLAANTNGFTGAEIENVVNESSFIALKRIKDKNLNEEPRVDYSDIEKGLEKVLKEKTNIENSKKSKHNKLIYERQELYRMMFPHVSEVINK